MKQISPPSRTWRAVLLKSIGLVDYSAFCFSASPRISPSDAPESEEPYCATACFSSAICNALIEKLGFLLRSQPITIASTFWPVWKRSGRCSSRSRPRSLRLMNQVAQKAVVLGKSVSVRLDLGGRRYLQQTTHNQSHQ